MKTVVKGALNEGFIKLLALEALKHGQRLAAEPVNLLILSVSHRDAGEKYTHHADYKENKALKLVADYLLTECKGNKEGAEREINRDYLVALALLKRELGVRVLVNVIKVVVGALLDLCRVKRKLPIVRFFIRLVLVW